VRERREGAEESVCEVELYHQHTQHTERKLLFSPEKEYKMWGRERLIIAMMYDYGLCLLSLPFHVFAFSLRAHASAIRMMIRRCFISCFLSSPFFSLSLPDTNLFVCKINWVGFLNWARRSLQINYKMLAPHTTFSLNRCFSPPPLVPSFSSLWSVNWFFMEYKFVNIL
jgi:hypothetical protein